MAKQCVVTGKSSLVGGRYSRTRATQYNPTAKTRRQANLQKRTVYIPELGKAVSLTLSAKALKTISKRGAYQTLKKAGVI